MLRYRRPIAVSVYLLVFHPEIWADYRVRVLVFYPEISADYRVSVLVFHPEIWADYRVSVLALHREISRPLCREYNSGFIGD